VTAIANAQAGARPPVFIEAAHYERLHALATLALDRTPVAAQSLLTEVDRAEILEEAGVGEQVVTVGAEVTYRDEKTRRHHTVRIVYPNEADIAQRKVSVLTPVGAALIGLKAGARIAVTGPDGDRELTVLRIRPSRNERRCSEKPQRDPRERGA
jgi:regulator of nucleoside diphosphate kinase